MMDGFVVKTGSPEHTVHQKNIIMNTHLKEVDERINRLRNQRLTGKTIKAQSSSHGNGWPALCGVIDWDRFSNHLSLLRMD